MEAVDLILHFICQPLVIVQNPAGAGGEGLAGALLSPVSIILKIHDIMIM